MSGGGHKHPRFPAWLSFALTRRGRRREYPPEAIVERLGVRATDAVLDFGRGPGFFTEGFAAKARRTVAVDAQPEMLQKARKRLGPAAANAEFIATEDGRSIRVASESIDLAFLAYVYHELEHPEAVLRELARTLTPGGRLVIMERTEPGWRPFQPPQIDADSVEKEVGRAGFAVRERIRRSRSTLLVFVKAAA